MLTSILVYLESLDTPLELQEHVQPDDHHLLQVGIRNLIVEEVPRDESGEACLEGSLRQAAHLRSGFVDVIFESFFASQGPQHCSEQLERYVNKEHWHSVNEVLLVDLLVKRVDQGHEPGAESCQRHSSVLSKED